MYFPTAEIDASPLLPVLAGFVVSFFMSMAGISGAFLLLPFQMSVLGYTNPSVSATNQLYNALSSPGGIYRYMRERRMVWPLAAVIMAGTVPGVMAGVIVRVRWLPDPARFKLFVAVVLLGIGAELLRDLLAGRKKTPRQAPAGAGDPARCVTLLCRNRRRIVYTYEGGEYAVSVPVLFIASLGVGLISGAYGIGGSAIMAPMLVSLFRLPIHTTAGATLLAACLTAVAGVAFFFAIAPFFPELTITPDWRLALLFGGGGIVGMYAGARAQKYVPGRLLKWMVVLILAGTAFSYLNGAL